MATALCVEIEANPDGTYSVVECSPREKMPNEAESEGQSYASIDEALSAAKSMLATTAGAASPDPASEFEAGFAGVREGAM